MVCSHPPQILTITPNPALDVTLTTDTLPPGATVRIPTGSYRLGGKGINVAAVAASAGYATTMMAPVSASALDFLRHYPDSIPTQPAAHWITTPCQLRHTYALHQSVANTTTMVTETGSAQPSEVWTQLSEATTDCLDQAAATDHPIVVVISGSWPPATPLATITDLYQAVSTHPGCAALIVDCAGEPLTAACEHGAIVKPNLAELTETTGHTNPIDGAHALLGRGAAAVIVSCGEDGLIAAYPSHTITAKLPYPLDGNPTGCGDALVAALATGHADKAPLQTIIRTAVAWSASAVLVAYAGAIDPQWEALLHQVQLTAVPHTPPPASPPPHTRACPT
ncbi:1-phosphofructokinase family hexose kinase [Corynebacterium choanae]|uniref:6-phosphofructokinase isozyme 2 n=1 Tax=Corynebacterium choanae TaxID=1862358 RepID=A0A3G6J5T2_9CORY|nr:PfkB family carbohydrate kinase [Corynebacterium choanae]AZA13309.1 6-phosphofructokinase isozyme 2 [Corynebacterium choanae]